jgi:hypothetical protein
MSTFHPFPRLPLELRFLIWELTVIPREVPVRTIFPQPYDPREATSPHDWTHINSGRFDEATRGQFPNTHAGFKAERKARKKFKEFDRLVHMISSVIPAPVQTCREARNHGLYQKVSLDVKEQYGKDRRWVWLNLDIDLLDIGTAAMAFFGPIAARVKRLKFSREATDEWWYRGQGKEMSIFVNVQEIHVVCLDGFWNWGDEVFNFHWPCAYENLVFFDPGLPEDQQGGIGHVEMRRWYRRELKRLRLLDNDSDWTDDEELVD